MVPARIAKYIIRSYLFKRQASATITGRFIHSVLSLSFSLRLSRLTRSSAASHRMRPSGKLSIINVSHLRLLACSAIFMQAYIALATLRSCQLNYILLRSRSKCPVLRFKDSGRLIYLHRVPGTDRKLCTIPALNRTKSQALYFYRMVIINHHIHTPLQTDNSLRRLPMPMNRHLCPRLQRIQHPLRSIIRQCTQSMRMH